VVLRTAAALAALLLAVAPQSGPDAWPVRFAEIANQAGLREVSVYGGLDRKRFIIETNGAGVALVDVDRDGWLDALVLSGTRLKDGARVAAAYAPSDAPTSHLYRNRGNGSGMFDDITDRAGLRRTGWASGVCAGDYDNDGWIDLFVTYFGRNVLYRNRGGRFEDVTRAAGLEQTADRWGSGCTFIDIDRDGQLDLFVANYLRFDLTSAPEPGNGPNCTWKGVNVNCGPKGLPTDTNLLFRNQGGRFADVSERSGIAAVTGRYSMTALAADLTGDLWPDIYVASDSTAAILYRNNRDGTFTDVAIESGAAFSEQGSPQAGMGLAAGDFNRDGLLDLAKTHFADDVPALYRNLGKGLFEDDAIAAGLGVQNRHVQWGAGLEDFDNDGLADFMVMTGHVYPEIERVLEQYPHRGPRLLFRNRNGSSFEDVGARSGPGIAAMHSSRGAAFGDVDNDGDVDVLVMNMNEPPSLLRNDSRAPGNWIRVQLQGTASNRAAIGATVIVSAAGRKQARVVASQSSYYSHNDLRLHFGLGDAARVDEIEVRWPNGTVQRQQEVATRRTVTIVER
jgi:hypothetical protein